MSIGWVLQWVADRLATCKVDITEVIVTGTLLAGCTVMLYILVSLS